MLLIPKVFHRIWLGSKPMPALFERFGETWAAKHPGWQMLLWTDDTLPHFDPNASAAFEAVGSIAAKADIARFEILNRYGGIYIDTDFECKRNIEELIDGLDCFLAEEREFDGEYCTFPLVNNAIVGAVRNHPFISRVISEIPANIRRLPANASATIQSGPFFITELLQQYPEVTIFPAKYFYPYRYDERWRSTQCFPEAYAVHHWSLSDMRRRQIIPDPSRPPKISVVLQSQHYADNVRLIWVLEGLCTQTVAGFDVFVYDPGPEIVEEYRGRLNIHAVSEKKALGNIRRAALHLTRANRLLFLDDDCVPDADLIFLHTGPVYRDSILYNFRRIYPAEKMFAFRNVIDYGALKRHSRPEHPILRVKRSHEGWRELSNFCFSAPTAFLRNAIRDRGISLDDDQKMADYLSSQGCLALPSLDHVGVTWMGPRARADSGQRERDSGTNVKSVPG
jgi:hypothetical protein